MIKNNRRILPKLATLVVTGFLLSGCQLYNPTTESQIYPVKMRLQQANSSESFSTQNRPDITRLKAIADHFNRTSDGPMVLQLNYASNVKGQAERAVRAGAQYKRLLHEYGVKNARVEMNPRKNFSQKSPEVQLHYQAWKATAPVGCGPTHMPGYYGSENPQIVHQYKMGCETETYLSKMVARPKDLTGNSGMAKGDSRHDGTVVEGYKSGTQNTPLNGLQASSLGGG